MSSRQSPSPTPGSPTISFQGCHSTSPSKSPTTVTSGFHLLSPVSANSQIMGSQHVGVCGGTPQRPPGGSQGWKAPSPSQRSPRVLRGSASPSGVVMCSPPSRVVSQSRAEEADDEPHPTTIVTVSTHAPSVPPLTTLAPDDIATRNTQAFMRLMELENQRMLQHQAESDDLVRRSCTVAPSQSNLLGSQHDNTPPPRGGAEYVAAESASPSEVHHRGTVQIGRASSLLADDGDDAALHSFKQRTPSVDANSLLCGDGDASPLRSQQSFQAEVSDDDGSASNLSTSSSVECIKGERHLYNRHGAYIGGVDPHTRTEKRPNEFDPIANSILGVGITTAAFGLPNNDDLEYLVGPQECEQPPEVDFECPEMPDYDHY